MAPDGVGSFYHLRTASFSVYKKPESQLERPENFDSLRTAVDINHYTLSWAALVLLDKDTEHALERLWSVWEATTGRVRPLQPTPPKEPSLVVVEKREYIPAEVPSHVKPAKVASRKVVQKKNLNQVGLRF